VHVSGGAFHHEVAFYDGGAALLPAVLPFVRGGVTRREPTLVAMPGEHLARVHDAMGSRARDVAWVDMTDVARNPACLIPAWRSLLRGYDRDTPVNGVGEPAWPGRRDAELTEALLSEALLNVAFEPDRPLRLLCPYDRSGLPADVVEEADRVHAASDGLVTGIEHARVMFTRPLPAAPRGARGVTFDGSMLGVVRGLVRQAAEALRLHTDTTDDLVLAVHEVAANSVVHAGGSGSLAVWRGAASLVVEVRDPGIIDDVLVGRGSVELASEHGRGIWIANQLCDLVQVRSGRHGTQVRLHTWL
jgi:anti-sigma regulatory factor (Ser/Thr protein kinase)